MKRSGALAAIGNTPLVRLGSHTRADLRAKLEFANPGGSVKDRSALFMVEQAEACGMLAPGATIVEASSGNQGIALAMIGAIKGYRVVITTARTTSPDKIAALRAYGADVELCEPTERTDDPRDYRAVARAIHAEAPGSFLPDQFRNALNPLAHYTWLAPEIWEQTRGRITHLFAAAGSGGTISGLGRYLKERNPRIRVHAVDAAGSFHSTGGHPKPYMLDGMGLDARWPTFDESVIDEVIPIADDEGFAMMRELPRRHGILAGPSSGAVTAAVQKSAHQFTADDLVVMIFGDSGRAYMGKGYFNPQPIRNSTRNAGGEP